MWYQTIPDVSALSFLRGVLHLFSGVLSAVIASEILRVFIGLALFMVAVGLFQLLLQTVKRV